MRRHCIIFIAILGLLGFTSSHAELPATASGTSLRETINFNRDWKFQIGDYPGAEQISFEDATWEAIGLPHTFSLPYFQSPEFYVGYGWYRKQFEIPSSWAGKRLFLEFEAAFQNAEIFLNGTKVGIHQGGYTGFQVDITSAARAGKNVLAVRLNNLWNPRIAPRAGEHTFSGGIYRNVWLLVTDPVHVAWYGTWVTTPKVSKSAATVKVQTEVRNDGAQTKDVTVQTLILDPDGRQAAVFATTRSIPAGAVTIFDQSSPVLVNPRLWHPDHPYLYRAVSKLFDGKTPVDSYETPFGIRWFEWTADKGFFLNGEHFYLRGANVHQDHAGWGDAVTDAGARRDVKLIKDAGFNFIRGSHYPHSPAFTRACDELGLIFWSENCVWGIGGKASEGYWNASAYPVNQADEIPFQESAKSSLTSMIRIHRNHPSIMVWSMSNEPFFTGKSTMPAMKNFLKELVDLTHKLDPTRPAAIGGAQRPLGDDRIDKVGDVAGYNGDGSSIPIFQDPGVANLVSEYGSVTSERPGKYEPNWGELAGNKSEPTLFPWRSGQSIWCGFDHGSIAGVKLGKMGIIDYFRIPKHAWYWYRNAYAKVPPPEWPQAGTATTLKLESDKVTGVHTDGTDDVQLVVTVLDVVGKPISNSPPVDLAVVSGPGEFPTGPTIHFEAGNDIRIQDGKAAMEFRSYYAGTTVIRATSPGLQPCELTISFEGATPFVAGKTPAVKPRPYHRHSKATQQKTEQEFGFNNPAFASSSADGLSAGLATDGKNETFWRPAPDDLNPSLTVDTEKHLNISRINLTFPVEGVYRYKVEISDDQQKWTVIDDYTGNNERNASREITIKKGAAGRFVRVCFPDAKAAVLSEIRITGLVID